VSEIEVVERRLVVEFRVGEDGRRVVAVVEPPADPVVADSLVMRWRDGEPVVIPVSVKQGQQPRRGKRDTR
jgi:hypothetical protein